MACHLAGACPHEFLDVTPWAEAAFRHFVRNPLGQRLPRKFKINFSRLRDRLRPGDVQRRRRDRRDRARSTTATVEPGFRVFIAGGLGANPHPALALEDFTAREDLLPTIEAMLRVFDQTGNRDNKLRARMKWVVDTLGIDELQRARAQGSASSCRRRRRGRAASPRCRRSTATRPAGVDRPTVTPTRVGQGTTVRLTPRDPYERWDQANVVRGVANGTVSAVAYARARRHHRPTSSVRSPRSSASFGADVRLTNRQNVVFRGLTEAQLPVLYARLEAIGMAQPGAELARDVVACPGADTCNIAVTQSRGLAKAIGDRLEEEGLAEVGGVRINISGCTNSCGQHHASDIGFFGAERRAHGRSAPGYQMLLGGYVGQEQIHFGEKALRLPAKNAPEARGAGRPALRRRARARARRSAPGSTAPVAAAVLGEASSDLDVFPTPDEDPDFYVDYGETGPYVAEIGESECAT